jgi:tetratricopeptide (TPR) repeat protein
MTDQFLPRIPALRQYLASNQLKLAEHELLLALAQYPESPSACRLMGSLQAQLGNFRAASEWTERYLSHCPTDSLALTLLASTKEKSGALAQSHALFDRAEQNAKTYQDFFELSVEADRQGGAEIALRAIDKAISLLPGKGVLHSGQAYLQRARILQSVGRSVDAAKIYRELIRKNLVPARAWFALLDLKTEKLSVTEYKALGRALEQATNAYDRALIGFALGKAHEDAANFTAALATFTQANDEAARLNTWNSDAFAKHAQQILAMFSPYSPPEQELAGKLEKSFGSELIFLVGLPRSGTTLVEQVLSAHPDVEGANELPYLPQLIQQESMLRGKAYPAWVSDMTPSDWRRLGDEYLSLTARWRTKRPKSTDKLPENWLYIGAIERMFPGSKIIDCLRDPVETVWSCYKQLFAPGRVNFSYRFEDLRDFWLSYRASMEVWGQRLPRRVYAQSYEMLVNDTETQVRALLDFCGLAFSEACLRPHLAQRVIRTPSASQVRMPMHAPSVKTHGYGEHLASLRALFH